MDIEKYVQEKCSDKAMAIGDTYPATKLFLIQLATTVYNRALEDAAEKAEVKNVGILYPVFEIDKQSILNLKKP